MDAQAWQYLILLAAIAVWLPTHGRKVWQRWQAFKAWEAAQAARESVSTAVDPVLGSDALPSRTIDTAIVPNAGTALLKPPGDIRLNIHELQRIGATKPYTFPLGWRVASEKPSLVFARLVGDVNHIALTGFTDSGKDSWAAQALFYLALSTSARKLQIAILDGKGGLSWIGWENKAHVWLLAEQPQDMRPAMDRLKVERERRQRILKAAQCEKWEEYQGADLPLLVVFVSELMLLQDATSKTELADWLNTELTSARASGIRYIVSGQTFTRLDTRWRSQIGLYVAGYQPRGDADEPNTSFSTKELRDFGTRADGRSMGVAPSELPVPPEGSGVFTCVQGRTVLTVRASHYPKEHRTWMLGQLPNREKVVPNPLLEALVTGQPIPIADAPTQAPVAAPVAPAIAYSNGLNRDSVAPSPLLQNSPASPSANSGVAAVAPLPVAPEVVPPEEQYRILDAAKAATSRGKLCESLYGVRGGQKYGWVQKVCDAAGLLVRETVNA
jgi:S-DNA-T family DNA segregation ATPase FtsK/SpoIIIE